MGGVGGGTRGEMGGGGGAGREGSQIISSERCWWVNASRIENTIK